MLRLLALLVLLATPAQAAPKHWYKSKTFWAAVAVNGAAIAIDDYSTARCRHAASPCIERNPLLGRYPSNQRIAWSGFSEWVGMGAATYLVRRWEHVDHPKLFWAVPAGLGAGHGWAAKHNFDLPSR